LVRGTTVVLSTNRILNFLVNFRGAGQSHWVLQWQHQLWLCRCIHFPNFCFTLWNTCLFKAVSQLHRI
jgi:hypothetical protein